MWCTGINGLRSANASALPKFAPTSSAPIRPGAQVAATASTSCLSMFASASAFSVTRTTASMCRRDAISGTTPPYSAWVSICVSTTLERMVRPSSMTAAAVSSQEDSSAKILIVSPVIFVLQNMARERRIVLVDIDAVFTRVLHADAHHILPLEQAVGIVLHLRGTQCPHG